MVSVCKKVYQATKKSKLQLQFFKSSAAKVTIIPSQLRNILSYQATLSQASKQPNLELNFNACGAPLLQQ